MQTSQITASFGALNANIVSFPGKSVNGAAYAGGTQGGTDAGKKEQQPTFKNFKNTKIFQKTTC